jgi:exopolysaccharide/PEP-CTERM locus tyrosine autokinase
MVTSATPGEGKSLTAINLAVSLAQEVHHSHSVLLIDADVRKPSLMEYLGITAETGLVDCLRDGAKASSVIIGTGIPKLDILPAGRGVRNPVELLSSPKMKALLIEQRRLHPERYIIIDTPPLLPFAETQIISQLVDGVLFVVKEGMTTVQELQECFDIMSGTKVLGIAFNAVSAQVVNNRYRHYSQYYAARQRRQV